MQIQVSFDPKSANTRPAFIVLSSKMKMLPRHSGKKEIEGDLSGRLLAETIHFPLHTPVLSTEGAARSIYTGRHVTRKFPGISGQSGAEKKLLARDAHREVDFMHFFSLCNLKRRWVSYLCRLKCNKPVVLHIIHILWTYSHEVTFLSFKLAKKIIINLELTHIN